MQSVLPAASCSVGGGGSQGAATAASAATAAAAAAAATLLTCCFNPLRDARHRPADAHLPAHCCHVGPANCGPPASTTAAAPAAAAALVLLLLLLLVPPQLKMSDQDLIYLSSAGRQLVAKPYSKRMSHRQGLEGCVAAAEVGVGVWVV